MANVAGAAHFARSHARVLGILWCGPCSVRAQQLRRKEALLVGLHGAATLAERAMCYYIA